jgi:circadian clock protein KaiC
VQDGAEHNRLLHLLKSRGMAHSNQCREFLLTDRGVELREVYTGPSGGLLTGSARATLEAQEKAEALVRELNTDGKKRELERKEHAIEAQIAVLRAEFGVEQAEAMRIIAEAETSAAVLGGNRVQMGRLRQSDAGIARPIAKLAKRKAGHAA